jgi:hypothetical protein
LFLSSSRFLSCSCQFLLLFLFVPYSSQ